MRQDVTGHSVGIDRPCRAACHKAFKLQYLESLFTNIVEQI
jgi:hypothetical protein